MLSPHELGYVLVWIFCCRDSAIIVCSNDALMISLDILSMPGALLLFCKNTADRSSVMVISQSYSSSIIFAFKVGSVEFCSVCSPNIFLK